MNKNKFLIKSYKQMFMVIGIFTLVLLVGGVTYAFFNYTRTGPANTLNTGRIYFSTEQTNNYTINLNNIFPMTKEQALADSSTNGTLVVTFNGDTEYTDGMEYLLSIDSVTGTTNVPISLIMDVNITENSVALTENTNYYTAREGKNASMYKVEGTDTVINSTNHKVITDIETGKYLLAGYIKSGEYGVNGTVTIKAFIDADNLLITDTPDDQSQRPSTAYTDGTDTTGKTVISTTDWNSLQSTGLSFTVRGEAREGIWVEEQLSRNDMKNFFSANTFTNEQKSSITEINFIRMSEEEINTHANLIDLTSAGGEGVVKGWIENNKLYVASPGATYFPVDSTNLLTSFFNVTNINFNNINTSEVTNMYGMFLNDSNLTSLDLSGFDTSDVTNMSYMFNQCKSLLEIDLSNFDTFNVTNISSIFSSCDNLENVILDNWNLSNISSSTNGVFVSGSIRNISCKNWILPANFSHWLFRSWSGGSSIETVDVTGWDLSNTTNISGLFAAHGSSNNLQEIIGLDTWDLSNITNVSDMFSGCTNLTSNTYYARTQVDADKFNNSSNKPANLTFVVR